MPLYDYECEKCGNLMEVVRKLTERKDPLTCEKDGGEMKQIIGAPAIRKGGGIYSKDTLSKDWGEYK